MALQINKREQNQRLGELATARLHAHFRTNRRIQQSEEDKRLAELDRQGVDTSNQSDSDLEDDEDEDDNSQGA